MSSAITRQFSLIQDYDELEKANKHPEWALYKGNLIIYRKDPDSLIERIQQAVSSLFYGLIGLFFKDRLVFDSNEIQNCLNEVIEHHSQDCLEKTAGRRIFHESLNKKIKELEQQIENLNQAKREIEIDFQRTSEVVRHLKEQESVLFMNVLPGFQPASEKQKSISPDIKSSGS